jgi:hypothetical protein
VPVGFQLREIFPIEENTSISKRGSHRKPEGAAQLGASKTVHFTKFYAHDDSKEDGMGGREGNAYVS